MKTTHHARSGRDSGAVCQTYGGTDHGTYDRAIGYPGTHNGTHSNTGTDHRADHNACAYGSAYGSAERSGYRYPGSKQ